MSSTSSKLKDFIWAKTTLVLVLFALATASCSSADEGGGQLVVEDSVVLNNESITLEIGGNYTLKATYTPDVKLTRFYSWVSSNPDVVKITRSDSYSALITAIKSGHATITLSSSDKEIEASLDVTVRKKEGVNDDSIIKVLAIGNSFSVDAVEQYLHDIALAENVEMVIGHLDIGGSSLEVHWNNAKDNTASYSYKKIALDGTKTQTSPASIATGVLDENWDYISFQQVSNNSGMYETFVPYLPSLIECIKSLSANPEVQFIYHQTWAYAENSTHSAFPNYNSNQKIMYDAIVQSVRRAQLTFDIDFVIPAGTAIQNGRSTFAGNSFTRDGYHLNTMGRYVAACTWFEAITGINVVGVSYKPEGLSTSQAKLAQQIAHAAVLNPDKVSLFPNYDKIETISLTDPVYVSFGENEAPEWNKIGFIRGSINNNMIDENGSYTNVSIVINQRFSATNTSGAKTTNTAFNMPSTVSNQSYFGNAKGVFMQLELRQSQFTLSGFEQNITYNLCFFASRGSATDNRETKYIVTGKNSETVKLNASNNSSEIVCVNNIQPSSNGDIIVTVTAGENNNNSPHAFYYISAMRISKGE